MTVKLAERIAHVTSKLQNLGFHSITLIAYRPGPSDIDGYYKLRAIKHNYKIFISELLIRDSIAKYSYTLLYGEKIVLRYDNAPHHPYIETFPHHKHENDEIKPLYNHSIESFIKEVEGLVKED
ncbi:MAG: DUF6516 family protein [Desulfurococcales archaeon]|nr:DUF6516 family protein [Desulfurococcales archaeon]